MKTLTNGVQCDTTKAEMIVNHDAEDNSASMYLYRTKEGKYFVRTEKLQIRKGGKWIDIPMDGSARGLPRDAFRHDETDTPMTENEAIDWFLATVAPKPLGKAIQQQIGRLVSFELGELAEPLARYCKDKGVSESAAIGRALGEYVANKSETEKAILHLQAAIAKRFGRAFDTDCGAGTVYISHDGARLTDPRSSIVAEDVGSIARQLTS